MVKFCTTALTFAVFLSACTWVKPTPEGVHVHVAEADAVRQCQKLSNVTVSLKHKVGRVERKPVKVANELETLARNEAAVMGGDTVVANNKPSEGRQEFGVYDCRSGGT